MKWMIPFFMIFAGFQAFSQECLQVAGTYEHEDKHDDKIDKMSVIVTQDGCNITVKLTSTDPEDMQDFPESISAVPAGKNPTTAVLTGEGFQIEMRSPDPKFSTSALRMNFKQAPEGLLLNASFVEGAKEKHFGDPVLYKKIK